MERPGHARAAIRRPIPDDLLGPDPPGRRPRRARVPRCDGGALPRLLVSPLCLTVGAVKMAAHRLRGRYRDRLRDEIARTVADPSEIDAEIRDLLAVLGD